MPEREQRVSMLSEWFSRHGIKTVLLDLDDTLLDTNDLFGLQIRRFISSVASKNPQLDWKETYAKFVELNDRASETLAVRKAKFLVVAGELDTHFNISPSFSKHADIVLRIYETSPELIDGAVDTLNAFGEIKMTMGLVTHANASWTNLKIDSHGLRKYFSHIEIVDENRHKSSQDWQRAIDKLRVLPEEVLIIGDNLAGDIISAYKCGVEHGIWIKPKWSVYSKGEIPDGVIKVDNIGQVIDKLIGGETTFNTGC